MAVIGRCVCCVVKDWTQQSNDPYMGPQTAEGLTFKAELNPSTLRPPAMIFKWRFSFYKYMTANICFSAGKNDKRLEDEFP